MAYIPGVKNDLFISYAHVDNEPDAHDKRWVSEFVRGLGVEVRQRLGGPKDFSLFFDESDLHAHHHLQILLENARQSAVFVAVLSPSYVSHDWTMKELREFAGLGDNKHRIIVVEKLPLEYGEPYPAEIDQNRRTPFWRRNEPESYTPSTLTAAATPAHYRQTLETLGHQVQQLLREMRRDAQQVQRQNQATAEQVEEKRKAAEADRLANERREQEARARAEREQRVEREQLASAMGEAVRRAEKEQLRQEAGRSEQFERATTAAVVGDTNERKPVASVEPQVTSAPAQPLMFDALWPKDETNWATRGLVALAVVAILSLALSWAFRSMVGPPANSFGIVATLIVGGAAFHLAVVGLGVRLAIASAVIVVIAIWTATLGIMSVDELWPLISFFIGIVAAAIVISVGVEHGWARGYWRLVLVTFVASFFAVNCLSIGVAATRGIIENFWHDVIIIWFVAAGYSVVATGVTEICLRLIFRQTPK